MALAQAGDHRSSHEQGSNERRAQHSYASIQGRTTVVVSRHAGCQLHRGGVNGYDGSAADTCMGTGTLTGYCSNLLDTNRGGRSSQQHADRTERPHRVHRWYPHARQTYRQRHLQMFRLHGHVTSFAAGGRSQARLVHLYPAKRDVCGPSHRHSSRSIDELYVQLKLALTTDVTLQSVLTSKRAYLDGTTPDPTGQWTGRRPRIFYSASIIWGAVSPRRFFAGKYWVLYLGFPFGAIVPVLLWLAHRRWPDKKLHKVCLPVIISGAILVPE